MSDIKNGDTVICPELFGDTPLTFVGREEADDRLNDCVVIHNNKAIAINFKLLIKLDPQ